MVRRLLLLVLLIFASPVWAKDQLVLGITELAEGSVWNTMPCHTHERRTEIYLYFRLAPGERIVHLAGPPDATRSLILANEQAVISPPCSFMKLTI